MLLPVCLCPPQFMFLITRLLSLFAAAATTTAAAAPPPPPPPSHGDGTQANTRHRLLMSIFRSTKPGMRSEEDDMHKPCAATDTAALLLSILVDDMVSLCSFLASHPLHSAYLLFFFPYLAQLLSFLLPLLLSTSLLLLVLLTASSYYLDDEPPPPAPPEFLCRTCLVVLDVLKDELHGSAGAYRLEQFASMFLSPIDDASPSARESAAEAVFGELFLDACSDPEADVEAFEDAEEIGGKGETFSEKAEASAIDGGVESPVPLNSGIGDIGEGETFSEKADASAINGVVEHPVPPNSGIREIGKGENFSEADASAIDGGVERLVPPNSGIGETFLEKANASATDGGIEPQVPPDCGIWGKSAETDDGDATEKAEEYPPTSNPSRIAHATSESIDSLQSYGSVKKEREWKRTLACKLYEERMTYKLCKKRNAAEGDEEMDLLWEAYEANATEGNARKKKEKTNRIEHDEEEEDEDDEEATVGQLCCLEALKLSTGKMNLGMGKKNLMKVSKVLKGFKVFARSNSKQKTNK